MHLLGAVTLYANSCNLVELMENPVHEYHMNKYDMFIKAELDQLKYMLNWPVKCVLQTNSIKCMLFETTLSIINQNGRNMYDWHYNVSWIYTINLLKTTRKPRKSGHKQQYWSNTDGP